MDAKHRALPDFPDFSDVHLVPLRDIPLSSAPEDAGLDVRPFVGHRVLGSMLPPSGVTMTWTRASAGEVVGTRSQATQQLVIVFQGSAVLAGPAPRAIKQGDVVTIPARHEYGFTNVGVAGLHALHVSFGAHAAAAAATRDVLTLEDLIKANERRADAVMAGPFFGLLRDRALDSERKRAMFLNCIRVFSDAFQTILYTRQATCRDDDFSTPFRHHLIEELGHNEFLAVPRSERAFADPFLRATANWFCHQMLVLDNLEKAVLVNLVLETAGYHFHTRAKRAMGGIYPQYFDAHSEEAEQGHKDGTLPLLERQLPETYRRLHAVLEDGWDMFDTMTRRIAHLVELEATSS